MSLWLGMMAGSLLAGGDFEPIATITVGAGGASSIEFTSIPGTYQHLQIRGISCFSSAGHTTQIRLNSDTGSNYSAHWLYGQGSSVSAGAAASATTMYTEGINVGHTTGTTMFASITDILDYASTTKNKTIRVLSGIDQNGSGEVALLSGSWMSTSAVTAITLFPSSGAVTFAQHSAYALYGVKA